MQPDFGHAKLLDVEHDTQMWSIAQPAEVFGRSSLCQAANARLEQEHPQIAGALHKFMIRVITRRLQLTTTTLQAVLT